MVKVEAEGDWMLLNGDEAVFAQGCRYRAEFELDRGTLQIEAGSGEQSERIEIDLSWPASTRGHLVAGSTRHAVDRAPEVVTLTSSDEKGDQQIFSAFKLIVLPDQSALKVLPYDTMILALRDDGALASRIQADAEAGSAEPADRAELSRLLCEGIVQRFPDSALDVSEDSITFTDATGARNTIELSNAWARIESGETGVVRRFLELGNLAREDATTKPPIFPLLKAKGTAEAFFAHARERAARDGGYPKAPLFTPVASSVECLFVFDMESGMRFLTASDLEERGLEEHSLPKLAAAELLRSLTTILRIEVAPGVYMLTCGGNYETALLLVPEVWAEVDPLLQGQRVVALPNRDLLFVTGADNQAGVAWMREQAASSAERTYPVTTDLLHWTGERYEVLAPKRSWLKRLFN